MSAAAAGSSTCTQTIATLSTVPVTSISEATGSSSSPSVAPFEAGRAAVSGTSTVMITRWCGASGRPAIRARESSAAFRAATYSRPSASSSGRAASSSFVTACARRGATVQRAALLVWVTASSSSSVAGT
jgi:hypothetical protein